MNKLRSAYLPILSIVFLHASALAAIVITEAIYLRIGLGASYSQVGSVLGAGAIGYLLFAPYIATIPKRIGAKNYLLWTSFILALAAITAANITNAGMYLITKTAIILLAPTALNTTLDYVENTFRYARNKDTLIFLTSFVAATGGLAGFLAGGVLADVAYGHAYLLATTTFLIAGFISLALPEKHHTERIQKVELNLLERLENCFAKKHRMLTAIIIATNAYWALRDFTIPLLLLEAGYGLTTIGILFAIAAISGILSMFFTRHALEKNHPEQVITSALLLATVSSIILPFGGLIIIGVMYALYVFADTALTPSISDRIEETAPPKKAQPLLKSLAAAAAIGWVAAPWVAGVLLEAGLSIRTVLFIAGLLMALIYELARRTYLADESLFPKLSFKRSKKHLIWR